MPASAGGPLMQRAKQPMGRLQCSRGPARAWAAPPVHAILGFLQQSERTQRRPPKPSNPSIKQACDQSKRARPHLNIVRPGIPPPTPCNSFRVPDRPSPPLREDDKDGHYVFELGENITSRYKILSKMGEGTFGRVLECWDRKHKDYVAIKIVRNIDKYRHAAMIELEVLNTLEHNDQEGRYHCVTLREWFEYRGHVCMVFEKLGPSLFDFLRKNEYRPFPLDLVQDFSRQLLNSVAYLHALHLVHTDLKPENILLCSLDFCKTITTTMGRRPAPVRVVPTSSMIKLIDFGSATFEDQHHSSIVSTRHYRAPEVILGLGWTYPCDMWSVGCIMVELLTGDALFQTHDNLEHLAMMEQVLGRLPPSMALRAEGPATKYFSNGRLMWPESATNKKSVKAVSRLQGLRRHILEHGDSSAVAHVDSLVDLLEQMLRYEPSQRITASQALEHPFFQLALAPSIPPTLPVSELGAETDGGFVTSQQATLSNVSSQYPLGGMPGSNNVVPAPPIGAGHALPPYSGLSGVAGQHLFQAVPAVVISTVTTASTANTHFTGW